jgi:tol-pal system protein YbgF
MVSMARALLPGCVAWAAALALASPAGAQSRREMQMMADIRMLQEQTQQLQQQLQAALQTLADSLKTINARMDEQTATSRKAFADQKLIVDQLGGDLRVVRERVDETNVRITSLSQEVEALRLAMPQYPPPAPVTTPEPGAAFAGQPATGGVPSAPVPAPPSTSIAPPAPNLNPQRMLDTAWADFTSGQWGLCVEGYSTYLKYFANTASADDAQYYVGECLFNDGKFTEAVNAFNLVIVSYPKGDKVPDAYYKRGQVLDRLGQPDRARESWETLMKQFPESDLARLAKQNLDRLNKGKPPGH